MTSVTASTSGFWTQWEYDPNRPRIGDFCCGAGGAAKGVRDSFIGRGMNPRIVGFDIVNQPHYPYSFVRRDVLEVDPTDFDFIWASPPCQRWAVATAQARAAGREYPDVLTPLRPRLAASRVPYIIENVPGAPLRDPVMLCGQMFKLRLLRHRYFESNRLLWAPRHEPHTGLVRGPERDFVVVVKMAADRDIWDDGSTRVWRKAMGISWMNANELSQAVPPKYAEFLTNQIIWP